MLVFKIVYMKYLRVTRSCLPLSLKFKLILASNVQIFYLHYFPLCDISPLIININFRYLRFSSQHTYLSSTFTLDTLSDYK